MSGLLSDHPLAELIHEISGARLSGVLRLTRGRARGAVYFDGGQVAGVLTNLRAYRLTETLRRGRAVAAEKLAATVGHEMSDDEAGAALVAAGLIPFEELKRLRERLAAEVLRQLLQWADGEWNFDARVRLSEGQRVHVEAASLLVESARSLSTAFSAKSFRDDGEKLSLAGEAATGEGVQLLPAEAFVLSRFDGPLSVGELVAVSGLPEGETRKALYVLSLGGLLSRASPPRLLPAAAYQQAWAPPVIASEQPAAKTTEAARASEDVKPHAPEPPAPEAAEPVRDPREELAELFARAEAATLYAVLGVSGLAKPDEIKRAYYALARRFHPDRFRRDVGDDERQHVELSFAKIAQAYEVLKDSKQRAVYDLKISAMRSHAAAAAGPPPAAGPDAAPPGENAGGARHPAGDTPNAQTPSGTGDPVRRAEEKFQQGMTALRQNDHAQAARYLGEAVLLAPQQARYRASLGRVLAREKATRRQAETELQAAIALDASNVSYRVMLAELYRDVGLRRRAESELEHALSIDRTNDAARRLLDELRRTG